MNGPNKRAVVIGGGVIGVASAYFLRQSGWDVTLVDKGQVGKGCSHGNCGYVSPSHVLPLAQPGAIGRTIKAMLSRNSPFSIRPRLSGSLWSWLFHFARRCNERDMLESGRAIQALLNSARKLYDELFSQERLDVEWEARGLVFVLLTKPAMEHFAEADKLLRENFGLSATRYDGDAVVELEPALKSGLAGGWHYQCDGHLRPDKLMSSWRALLIDRGVSVHEQCEFQRFVGRNGRAAAVQTNRDEFAGDMFVVATGAWTPLLKLDLGCRIPIQPGKGYSMTMARPARCPKLPMLFEEHRVGVTPMQSGYRLGSIMEFAGYDPRLNRRRLRLLTEGAKHYLHEPTAEPVVEEWFGWRPMTWDSRPIIGRSPALSNVFLAAGHNMLGLSMAPATGKLIAELANGAAPHVDPAPYSPARF
jgi:D-amino-acid dehydrogenase